MKAMKKIFAMLLTVVMVLGLTTAAFAEGETGKITISNPTIGATYNVYKVFDLTYSGTNGENVENVAYTYTKTDGTDALYTALTGEGSPFTLTETTETGVYNVSTQSDAAEIAEFLKGLVNAGTLSASATAITPSLDKQEVEFTGLDFGYYYVSSSLGAAVTITSTTPEAEVYDKNTQQPTVPDDNLKTIIVNGQKVSATTASVGDILNFRIALNTVNWVTSEKDGKINSEQVTTYTITDTPTNMKIDATTVVVKVGDTTLTKGTDYTLTVDEETGKMTVVITWVNNGNSLYANDSLLEVTYNAEITSGAVNGIASNSASAQWNESTPITDTTEVKTYSLDLNKVDKNDKALVGAKFELYDAETGGNKIDLVKETDGSYRPATREEKNADNFVSAVIEAGSVTIKGLGNGDYYLEEIEAPAGYNKLTSRVKRTITNANLTGNSAVKVVNESGTALPSTGGIGTTIFYVIGSILVLGAAILLITKRRMSGAQK